MGGRGKKEENAERDEERKKAPDSTSESESKNESKNENENENYLDPLHGKPGPFGRCYTGNFQSVKEIADYLDIPLYVTSAQAAFKDEVLDPLIAAKLEGRNWIPCLNCNYLRLKIMWDKASLLELDAIATGHFAKIKHQTHSNTFQVCASADRDQDQSFELSSVSQDLLSHLILPLAEMKEQEVIKIASSLGIEIPNKEMRRPYPCFLRDPLLPRMVECLAAGSLHRKGIIFNEEKETSLGHHLGLHHFYLGQDRISPEAIDHETTPLLPNLESGASVKEIRSRTNQVIISKKKTKILYILVEKTSLSPGISTTHFLRAYLRPSIEAPLFPVLVYFKTNGLSLLQLEPPGILSTDWHLSRGLQLCLYGREGAGAPLLLTCSFLRALDAEEIAVNNPTMEIIKGEEENRDPEKILPKLDFEF